jgi:threonine dehydrogenase-like Zn-dependent dehydrogenase
MKKATLYGPRDLRVEELTLDSNHLAPDQLWVETRVTALSTGTDRGNYEGAEQVPGAPPYPRWVGYSNVGSVRKTGEVVTRFRVGDLVFATAPHQSDYLCHESDMLVKVPPNVMPEKAALTYLYFIGLHALRRGNFVPGENVAVIGLGILGLGTVELARAFGGRVIAVGNDESRLAKAKEIGAHLALHSADPELTRKIDVLTGDLGIDLVVLAANPWSAYRTAMEVVRKNGRIAVLSLPGRGEASLDLNPLDLKWFYGKALTIIAVNGMAMYLYPTPEERFNVRNSCAYLLSLMAEGTIRPVRLITHRLPYWKMVEAYELAYRREKSMIGTVFSWNEASAVEGHP